MNILSPGDQIKPTLTLGEAITLAETLYGLRIVSATQLNGYDDLNFHIKVSSADSNPHMQPLKSSGYVFKVMNCLDSNKIDYVEGQKELLLYLDRNGFMTSRLQKNVQGEYYSVEVIKLEEGCKSHVVRLLTFQPGVTLKDVPWSYRLFVDVGRRIAELDHTLENFRHEAYDSYNSIWMLKNVPQLLKFLCALQEESRVSVVQEVVKEFEDLILTKLDKLTSGMIHGDPNEQNILCNKTSSGEWEVCGILDYGDAHYSAYIFDLAITMTYMILQSQELRAGGFVLSGYLSIKPLPEEEIRLLQTCVSARICQSVVLGAYSYLQDPGNEYILSTQNAGWNMLTKLRQSLNSVQSLWKSCNLSE